MSRREAGVREASQAEEGAGAKAWEPGGAQSTGPWELEPGMWSPEGSPALSPGLPGVRGQALCFWPVTWDRPSGPLRSEAQVMLVESEFSQERRHGK